MHKYKHDGKIHVNAAKFSKVAEQLQKYEDQWLGQQVVINGDMYEVAGVLQELPQPMTPLVILAHTEGGLEMGRICPFCESLHIETK